MFGDALPLLAYFQTFIKFYGFDWYGLILGNCGVFLVTQTKRQKLGFFLGASGNLAWFSFAFIVGSIPNMIASAMSCVMYAVGFVRKVRESDHRPIFEIARSSLGL